MQEIESALARLCDARVLLALSGKLLGLGVNEKMAAS